MTETEKIIRLLERSAAAPSEEEILGKMVADWLVSPVRGEMLTGERYYRNRNDILSRRRMAVGESGRLTEDPGLPNRKVSHGFVRKLVDQKSQYLFGRPFTVSTDNEDFGRLLEGFFDRQMRDRMKNLCKEAVTKGIAWLQLWPEDGKVFCKKLPAEEMIPIWTDREHTELEAMMRVYAVECHEGGDLRIAVRAEHWDKEKVRYFELTDGKLVPDVFCPEKPHLLVNGEAVRLPVLPFVPFKYNEEELPLIRFVKDLVDDYDLLKSEDSSNLSDTSGAIMVLKDYDGTDLGEFRRELSRYRAVKVSDSGGLEIREMPVHT
ncbi:MAG: phage portal protein, partial [Oscillospiraceae bacterium]|nr:phage portal protein [Oscillospiraceae bacterium]